MFSFRLEHPWGFEPTMRLDAVGSKQGVAVAELEVRCRLKSRYDTISFFYSVTDGTSRGKLLNMRALGDRPGHFWVDADPQVLFRTRHRQSMASCRLLEVEAIYKAQMDDSATLYFRPRGVGSFSGQHARTLPVFGGATRNLSFVVESAVGFEEALRFDPVRRAQDIQFDDVRVRCLKRLDLLRAHG